MNFIKGRLTRGRELQRQVFYEQNRHEVKAIYRDILKKTSRAMPRKMGREAKLAEFRYMFRECMHEEDID